MRKKTPPDTPDAAPPADDLFQRALDAAAVCVERDGLQKTSMDDIAAESGISRATLYRRVGSREALLLALLMQQARPFVEASVRLASSARTLAERLEISTVHAVKQATLNPTLRLVFGQGASPANLDFVRPVYRQLVHATLLPSLDAARATGELRPGLDNDELVEWLLGNFLMLVAAAPWDDTALLRHIRQYTLPVLIPDAHIAPAKARGGAAASVEQRLGTMDHRLAEVQQALSLLRLEVGALRGPARARSTAGE